MRGTRDTQWVRDEKVIESISHYQSRDEGKVKYTHEGRGRKVSKTTDALW